MGRRAATNVALGLLVIALAATVAIAPPDRKAAAPAALGGAPTAAAESIRILRPGAPPIAMRRTGAEWSLVEPLYAPADPRRVRELLAVPGLPALHEVESTHTDLARFELDPPLVTLQLDAREFAFGSAGALDGGRYAAHGGRVFLVPDTAFLRLTQGPGFFIDPALIKAGLRPVRIALPGRILVREDGRWREGSGAPSGEPAAARLAAAWTSARAIMVRVGTGQLQGQKINIVFESGPVAEFEFVADGPQAILLRRDLDLQYHLDAGTARALLLPAAESPAAGDH